MDSALDHSIREFLPKDDSFVELEGFFEAAFSSADPTNYYDAIFNLFERFPEDDGSGVFWSALHGMEHVGGYEVKLKQYHRRWPNIMTNIMLQRIANAAQDSSG